MTTRHEEEDTMEKNNTNTTPIAQTNNEPALELEVRRTRKVRSGVKAGGGWRGGCTAGTIDTP
jgi:hypothetical protein